MSARSHSNSNLCLRFDGTEIESLNHTDFDNLSCERVVAKPTGEGLNNCDLGEACASITTPIVGRTPDNVGREAISSAFGPQDDPLRKIKTQHRKLVLDINRCAAALLACNSYDQFQTESLTYGALFVSKTSFLCAVKNLVDKDLSMELS